LKGFDQLEMVSGGFPFGNVIERAAAADEHQQGDSR
jgi:hypothetical protein